MSPEVQVEVWSVHDTGLVAAPGRFRRLPGAVRHHQSRGDPWPARVVMTLTEDTLRVTTPGGDGVGSWLRTDVEVRVVGHGPPVSFILELPDAAHLLSAAADDATRALLASLG